MQLLLIAAGLACFVLPHSARSAEGFRTADRDRHQHLWQGVIMCAICQRCYASGSQACRKW